MEFFEIFTSARYHRDMKILKILASNSKRFTFYGIFKTWQIDRRGRADPPKYYIFLDNFCLKQPLVLKLPLGVFFWLKKLKKDIEIALKPTGIEL